jgi:predicted amidophosphoribosyltransferase
MTSPMMTTCAACQSPMSTQANVCPRCGHPNAQALNASKNTKIKMIGLVFLLLFVALNVYRCSSF